MVVVRFVIGDVASSCYVVVVVAVCSGRCGGSDGGRGWLLVAEVTERMWVVVMVVVVGKKKFCLSMVFVTAVSGKRRLRGSV